MKMKKCFKCGVLSDCYLCFECSGEEYKTHWRKKYRTQKTSCKEFIADLINKDPKDISINKITYSNK